MEVLIGDINIDLKCIYDNTVNNYVSIFNSYGFLSVVNGPTRVTSNSRTHIDHIFLRRNLVTSTLGYSTYIINSDITDHFPIMINFFSENHTLSNADSFTTKIISKVNYCMFGELLNRQDWSIVTDVGEVEVATENFATIINNIKALSTENKVVKYRTFKKIRPWITNGLVSSIKQRDKMKKKLLKNYSDEDAIKYKKYRNVLNRLLHNCKSGFYRNKVNNCNKDIKKVYQIITEATNGTKPKDTKVDQITDEDNKPFVEKKNLAQIIVIIFL